MFQSKKDIVYVVLAGIFITNAVVAELIGGKLIDVGPAVMSIGILPWPIVFVTTDLINEYFGEKGVRKLSIITACLIAYTFIVLGIAFWLPGIMDTKTFFLSAMTGYSVKLAIAVLMTPLIYLGHNFIDKYIAKDGK